MNWSINWLGVFQRENMRRCLVPVSLKRAATVAIRDLGAKERVQSLLVIVVLYVLFYTNDPLIYFAFPLCRGPPL